VKRQYELSTMKELQAELREAGTFHLTRTKSPKAPDAYVGDGEEEELFQFDHVEEDEDSPSQLPGDFRDWLDEEDEATTPCDVPCT